MTTSAHGLSLWDRFEAESDHGVAVECAWRWLEALPTGLEEDALSLAVAGCNADVPPLASSLRSAGLGHWADRVADVAQDGEAPNASLGRALLFRAGLRFVTTTVRDDLLDIAKAAFDPRQCLDFDAPDELAEALAGTPDATARLEAALSNRIVEGKTDPNRLAWRPRSRELDPVEPTTQNLWSRHWAQALVRHPWAYAALRISPATYTRLLHELPVGLAHTTVMLGGRFTLDNLQAMLRLAPDAFSSEGAPVSSGALYALLEKAHQELATAEGAGETPPVDALVDAVLSRADGPWIGRSWCQRVLWEVSHHKATEKLTWPGRLFNALTAKLEPLPDASSYSWVQAERLDLWQVDRVLVEAAILLDHNRRTQVPALFAWALANGLVTDTGRERALNTASFEFGLVGQIFTGVDLQAWFTPVWNTGYARRERHRISTYRKIDDTARATLSWGLAGLNTGPADVVAAWDAIFLALREVYLLDGAFNWIGDGGLAIFRFAAAVCTGIVKRGDLPADRLERFVELVIEPSIAFGSFVAMMAMQDEGVALAAAKALPPGRVLSALERGTLSFPSANKLISAEALETIRVFAGKLE
jgi:hypothetical protein